MHSRRNNSVVIKDEPAEAEDLTVESDEDEICEFEHLRKLFIGGLAVQTNEESLRSFYEQWGKVVDCVVMRDPVTKRSRGFGFITYTRASMVDKAQKNRPHTIDGKNVEAKRALPRPERTPNESKATVKKIFVGGLKDNHDEDCLREHFSQFGNVVSVKILTDRTTGKRRGFAFVEFDDYDAVDKTILQKTHSIKYVLVDVKKSVYSQDNKRTGQNLGGGQDNQKHSNPFQNRGPMNRPPMNAMNGPPMNGPYMNGPPMNGPPMNGPPMNGPPMNGPPMNGPPMNGPPMNGPPMNGPPGNYNNWGPQYNYNGYNQPPVNNWNWNQPPQNAWNGAPNAQWNQGNYGPPQQANWNAGPVPPQGNWNNTPVPPVQGIWNDNAGPSQPQGPMQQQGFPPQGVQQQGPPQQAPIQQVPLQQGIPPQQGLPPQGPIQPQGVPPIQGPVQQQGPLPPRAPQLPPRAPQQQRGSQIQQTSPQQQGSSPQRRLNQQQGAEFQGNSQNFGSGYQQNYGGGPQKSNLNSSMRKNPYSSPTGVSRQQPVPPGISNRRY